MIFNSQMLDFISSSPTPYHAVANGIRMLENAGFQLLNEADEWNLTAGGRL